MILAKAAAVIKKDCLNAIRYRNGFVLSVISPAAQLATFYCLSRAIGPQFRPQGMPYIVFLTVGMGFYTFLISGIQGFVHSIQEAQNTGMLEVLMSSGTRAGVLVMLSAVSAFAGNFLQFVLYVLSGMLLFAPQVNVNFAGIAIVLILSIVVAVAVGLCAAALQILMQKGSAVMWLLGSGTWLMAGTLFPVSALPRPLRLISDILPFTHSLTGMRIAVTEGMNLSALMREIWMLAIFAAVLLPLGVMFFSWTVQRARQSGSLSFY